LQGLPIAGERLFGTDGVRGLANIELTADLALALGRAAGSLVSIGPALVGRDTRRSGEMLSLALQAGFHSVGIDTVDVGVLTAGGISHLTATGSATIGAVVSASHNPAADNGIKFLTDDGTKLSDDGESAIEAKVRAVGSGGRYPVGEGVGTRFPLESALDDYVDYLASVATYTYRGLGLVLDCANGAAYRAAPALFRKLRADVTEMATEPDGTNINLECGSTHPEFLVAQAEGRIGLAFDGDADRLIAVDEDGEVVDGDGVMAIVARHWKSQGKLKNDLVVSTVMANLGFRQAMDEIGVQVIETQVGDRYVLEAMRQHKAVLGGEQSGHVIFLDKGRTGDGLLTGVRLLDVVAGTGRELRDLRREAMTRFPQVLVNVEVADRGGFERNRQVREAITEAEEGLGEKGRVLVRASGTEPVVRVMVEAALQEDARRYADEIARVIADVGR
jgi:phosphoglucosamine mutase